MIPAAFDYSRPASLDEALELVSRADPGVRVLAGGQSLIPLMKLRFARPDRLVDIGRLSELRGVTAADDGGIVIGALTTWATLLAEPRVTRIGALADALPGIGDTQVRNLGTIGGSLAHADPASDIAAPALALGFEIVAASAARGERSIAIDDFFLGPFTTALAPDEILTAVHMPLASSTLSASAYVALPQPASGYPIAGVAVSLEGRPLAACRIAVTGVGETPYRASSVERAILGRSTSEAAVSTIADGQRVGADVHASRDYRAAMAMVMARRALETAAAGLGS